MSFFTLRRQLDDLMNQMLMTHPSAGLFLDPFFEADLPLVQGFGGQQQQQLTSSSGDQGQQDQGQTQGQQQLATQGGNGGQMQSSFGQLFQTGLVKVDVHEDKDNFHVSAEIPGVEKDKVQVNVNDGYLTISGKKEERKQDEKQEGDRKIRRSERRYGSFSRSFRLPPTCDQEKVCAKFDNGVLQVSIPKTAQEKPQGRQIQIQ
jgi:HSP20 family molecular chaperone IbpA